MAQKPNGPETPADSQLPDQEPEATETEIEAGEIASESGEEEGELDATGVESSPTPDTSPEETLRQERDELAERWLRSVAELENFRKRARPPALSCSGLRYSAMERWDIRDRSNTPRLKADRGVRVSTQ